MGFWMTNVRQIWGGRVNGRDVKKRLAAEHPRSRQMSDYRSSILDLGISSISVTRELTGS